MSTAVLRRLAATLTLLGLLIGLAAGEARGDGDPGSDVLVYQPLFAASDAGLSVAAQLRLGELLRASARAGAPIRVAIIARRDDLGSVTGWWRRPQGYARFLGYELSLGYTGRLLVVMPDGLGFVWAHHSPQATRRALGAIRTSSSPAALSAATTSAIRTLDGEAGVHLELPTAIGASATRSRARPAPSIPTITGYASTPTRAVEPAAAPAPPPSDSGANGTTDALVALLALVAIALGGLVALLVRRSRRAPSSDRRSVGPWRAIPWPGRPRHGLAVRAGAGALVAAAGLIVAVIVVRPSASVSGDTVLADNPVLDPGTPLTPRPAPGFTLVDQTGRRVSLRDFRGKVTLLDFNDAECTTICPLTTTAMLDAQRMLGPAGRDVQLLGVDADPKATAIEDTVSYTQLHGLTGHWRFLTGRLRELEAVWRDYRVQASIDRGLISHTPALFVIDPQGRLRRLYMTQQSYAAVGQFGQILAREAASLLPGHLRVDSHLSYAPPPTVSPSQSVTLPGAHGGRVRLGPGRARLYVFFDTWDQGVAPLAGDLDALDAYAADAARDRLPTLTAVDEGAVEPSPRALSRLLAGLPSPLRYPVAVDTTGQVGDGYEVQGEPSLVLVSRSGRIVWYDAVDTSRWPTIGALRRQVGAALAPAGRGPVATPAALLGSPAPLARLHRQANRLIGGDAALAVRIHALRGYPIVVNAWASWCDACQAEFPLFARAAEQFGRQVAFLGIDSEDFSPADAAAFLRRHPVSYPSYRSGLVGLRGVLGGGIGNLPTTFFIDRAGRLTSIHTGEYDSQGTLDAAVKADALAGGG